MTIMDKKAIIEKKIPIIVAMWRGVVVKETIPSMEYLNSSQNDQLVSPFCLSMF